MKITLLLIALWVIAGFLFPPLISLESGSGMIPVAVLSFILGWFTVAYLKHMHERRRDAELPSRRSQDKQRG